MSKGQVELSACLFVFDEKYRKNQAKHHYFLFLTNLSAYKNVMTGVKKCAL